MKKNLLFIVVAFVSMSLSASIKQKQTAKIITSFSQQNEISISAYVQIRNEWVEGYVYLVDGVITRCQFPDIEAGMTIQARIYQRTKPSILNPNNPMAIKNNFTHFVDIPNYGRAYFIM
jgi:hypothetical protein